MSRTKRRHRFNRYKPNYNYAKNDTHEAVGINSMGKELAEELETLRMKPDDRARTYITAFVRSTYTVADYGVGQIKIAFKDGSICKWIERLEAWAYSDKNYVTQDDTSVFFA